MSLLLLLSCLHEAKETAHHRVLNDKVMQQLTEGRTEMYEQDIIFCNAAQQEKGARKLLHDVTLASTFHNTWVCISLWHLLLHCTPF